MEVPFRSVEFFRALHTLMQNDRDRCKRLGRCATTFGILILDRARHFKYVLGFAVDLESRNRLPKAATS